MVRARRKNHQKSPARRMNHSVQPKKQVKTLNRKVEIWFFSNVNNSKKLDNTHYQCKKN